MSEESNNLTKEVLRHPFWSMSVEETRAVLRVSDAGLSEEEAMQRLSLFGPNAIDAPERLRAIRIFFNQFRSPLILILIAAGAATLFLREFVDAGVIFAAVLVNTCLGFWQEHKAETVLELLRSYIRTRARARRGGKEEEIDAEFLVPGDTIVLSRGDRIPADARVIYANAFEVDESVLTGESLPQEKSAGALEASVSLPDRTPMVFSGTLAVEGVCEAIVTATDAATEFGKISELIRKRARARDKTPLQEALARFSLWAGIGLSVLIAALFFIGILHRYAPFDMFLISVAVAVSAVPEGLPIALTVILAVGVERLSRRNAVVRKLLAAETLGSTTLILTDKTGTLTEARMAVEEVVGWKTAGEGTQELILAHALLHSTAIVENPSDPSGEWRIVGNPHEIAIVREAARRGVPRGVADAAKIAERMPFDAARKFAAVCVEEKGESMFVLLGAPDALVLFARISDKEREEAMAFVEERALAGGRILAVASKLYIGDVAKEFERLSSFSFGASAGVSGEADYTLEGFIILRDPLRPGVRAAIQRVRAAGVRTIIVTGDHKGTAEAVARELGMVDGSGAVLTGGDLHSLEKEELLARAEETTVFARVTPEQKMMLVNLYKEKGEVVAVTGDGVNDAPALEAADIGVAVGSGTDVTKSAADLVVLDDNYETIVEAIAEGRRILDNIKKVIVYLLSNTFDELLLIGGSIVIGIPIPLSALQILFVNFFSDSFPAVALAFEKGIDGLGSRPRRLNRNLFDREMKVLILAIGTFTSVLLFVGYWFLLSRGLPETELKTFIFASFAVYTLILSFSLKSLHTSIISYNPFSNFYLVSGVLVGCVLTALVIYIPFFQSVFGTVSLSWPWLLGVAAFCAFNMFLVEAAKAIFRRMEGGGLSFSRENPQNKR